MTDRDADGGAFEWVGETNVAGRERWPECSLVCVVEEYDDRPDRYTVHPRDLDEAEALAQWLSADASGFVSIDEMR